MGQPSGMCVISYTERASRSEECTYIVSLEMLLSGVCARTHLLEHSAMRISYIPTIRATSVPCIQKASAQYHLRHLFVRCPALRCRCHHCAHYPHCRRFRRTSHSASACRDLRCWPPSWTRLPPSMHPSQSVQDAVHCVVTTSSLEGLDVAKVIVSPPAPLQGIDRGY